MLDVSLFYLALLVILVFFVNAVSFLFKSELFTRLEIPDLPINPFSFIFVSSISLVNLL